jgi:hypothetical protein
MHCTVMNCVKPWPPADVRSDTLLVASYTRSDTLVLSGMQATVKALSMTMQRQRACRSAWRVRVVRTARTDDEDTKLRCSWDKICIVTCSKCAETVTQQCATLLLCSLLLLQCRRTASVARTVASCADSVAIRTRELVGLPGCCASDLTRRVDPATVERVAAPAAPLSAKTCSSFLVGLGLSVPPLPGARAD